jgi:hypothetical protein
MSSSPVSGRPERRALWTSPWWMSGADVRAACRLPAGARLAFLAVVVVLAVGLQFVPPEEFFPAMIVYVGLLLVAGVALREYTLARRRRAGLVQVTPSEFDLLCALSQVPADRIVEARELQQRWVDARRATGGPDASTAQLEMHMRALIRPHSTPGLAPHE